MRPRDAVGQVSSVPVRWSSKFERMTIRMLQGHLALLHHPSTHTAQDIVALKTDVWATILQLAPLLSVDTFQYPNTAARSLGICCLITWYVSFWYWIVEPTNQPINFKSH
jgi:hypothetical protein